RRCAERRVHRIEPIRAVARSRRNAHRPPARRLPRLRRSAGKAHDHPHLRAALVLLLARADAAWLYIDLMQPATTTTPPPPKRRTSFRTILWIAFLIALAFGLGY